MVFVVGPLVALMEEQAKGLNAKAKGLNAKAIAMTPIFAAAIKTQIQGPLFGLLKF
jgi:superfamily II DNA helicase RecQ